MRITRGNTSSYSNRRFCVEKSLTKPRVCGIIVPASERGSPRSNRTLRGIAQLVEQRSPNVNRSLISRIITGFLRLETSVSSLFSCLFFLQAVKVIYAKLSPKPAKDFGTASKDQHFFIRLRKAVFRCLKMSD